MRGVCNGFAGLPRVGSDYRDSAFFVFDVWTYVAVALEDFARCSACWAVEAPTLFYEGISTFPTFTQHFYGNSILTVGLRVA